MTELAFNIAGWGFTILLGVYGGAILWLHTWLRSVERNEVEDDADETDYLLSSPSNEEHLTRSMDDFMRAPFEASLKHLDEWRNR